MSPTNGPSGEMDDNLWPPRIRDPLHLDDGTVDRLLDGLPVDDAPPSYRGVAELLAHDQGRADDGAGEAHRGPRSSSPHRGGMPRPTTRVPKPRSHRRLRRASAALVGSATLFVGLGAAGALPGAAQVVASNVLATVGVNTPNPDAPVDVNSRPTVNSDGPSGATIVNPGGQQQRSAARARAQRSPASPATTPPPVSTRVRRCRGQRATDRARPDRTARRRRRRPVPRSGRQRNGNGDNGNHNGADNGNGANNGNAYAGEANAGARQARTSRKAQPSRERSIAPTVATMPPAMAR